MGVITWIALGVAGGLLANMLLLPGKRSQGVIFICLTGVAGVLGGGWAASLFSLDGMASVSAWLAVVGGAAVLLLACYLLTGPASRPGGFMRRGSIPAPP